MVAQMFLGSIINSLWRPNRKNVPWHDVLHQWFGRFLFLLGLANIPLGMVKYAQDYELNTWMFAVFGLCIFGGFLAFGVGYWKYGMIKLI